VDAAIEVHRELGGPGLLEDVYEEALAKSCVCAACSGASSFRCPSITKAGFEQTARLDLRLRVGPGGHQGCGDWNPVFEAQMLTYLRLTGLKLGLVINFGETVGEERSLPGCERITRRPDFKTRWKREKLKTVGIENSNE